ncbi:hypothetical protein OIU84_000590 [Salix udensis]|uniref:Pentatricopeptide repeat-containing protein n=1 Tax=Salix udensis TaxID=889485 RepID=A0AAD6PML1_9ROSI|nr:hypothetical protein OIU84_000590 [Salix udensis]
MDQQVMNVTLALHSNAFEPVMLIKPRDWNPTWTFICLNPMTLSFTIVFSTFTPKSGQISHARKLFDEMTQRDNFSWNAMLSLYAKSGFCRKWVCRPGTGCIFRGCRRKGVFGEIREKDEVCWTTMIVGCAQNGMEEDALLLFSEMLVENSRSDGYTISSVVSSCAKLASLYHGQVVHGKAFLMGVNDDLLVSSALVDMYCKCGVTRDAWAVFRMMPTRNVISWNSMIGGYAQNGQDLEALSLL